MAYEDASTYNGIPLNLIQCRHIIKGCGSVSVDCSDFPDKCLLCKNNRHTEIIIPKRKSYYKYFGEK